MPERRLGKDSLLPRRVKGGLAEQSEMPRGEIAAEAPKVGGAETSETTASPTTAGSGVAAAHGVMTASPTAAEERPAAAPAGTTEGPSRGGG